MLSVDHRWTQAWVNSGIGHFHSGKKSPFVFCSPSPVFTLYRMILVAHRTWRLTNCLRVLRLCAAATPPMRIPTSPPELWGFIVTAFQGPSTQKAILNGFVHPGGSLCLARTFQNHSRPTTFSPLRVFKGYILLTVAKDECHEDRRGTRPPNFG